jgi:hypothetical protein
MIDRDNRQRRWSDNDYAYASTPLQLFPLGDAPLNGGLTIPILGKSLPESALTTLHPWAPGLFAPGEVLMYGDTRHTYLVRSRWTNPLVDVLTDSMKAAVTTTFGAVKKALLAPQMLQQAVAVEQAPVTAGLSTGFTDALGTDIFRDKRIIVDAVRPRGRRTNAAMSFTNHYHPYVCAFFAKLNAYGLPGLLTLDVQRRRDAVPGDDNATTFRRDYAPTTRVDRPYPRETVDFSLDGAYSAYNWELFFHAPLMIATTLSADQKFDEAEQWFHYIFNPTNTSAGPAPARFWNVLPFHEAPPAKRLSDLLADLDYTGTDLGRLAAKAAVQAQLKAMAQDPFNPHHIARLRPVAYQKTVVMRYVEHTLARGDQHFRRNELDVATLYYLRAAAVLGPRPQVVPEQETAAKSYRDLLDSGGLNDFSNALVALENAVPFTVDGTVSTGSGAVAPLGTTYYFCVPPNAKLLGCWDAVADRLFKIRHGLDIDGVARQVPLFEPPIDPGLLVRAKAAGVDLDSVLADLSAPPSHYRFPVLLERARRLCQELGALGAALLSALEKKDAEALAGLRSTHEIAVLDLTKRIKAEQVKEAEAQRAALDPALAMVTRRRDFFAMALQRGLIEGERSQLRDLDLADSRQQDAAGIEMAAQLSNLLPNFVATTGLGAQAGITFGGQQVAAVMSAISRSYQYLSSSYTHKANRAAIVAEQTRRTEEWQRELDMATFELNQLTKQIAAADVRVAMAEHEVTIHEAQTEQAHETLDFLRDKYTGEQLYTWLSDQVSTVYFQTYRLAYDLAKQAERAYRSELGVADSDFIRFGHWDSVKRGLLAGERLDLALNQLDDAYHRHNRRELEITKSISLLLTDPLALLKLKATGACEFTLPEALFDADYPGHYLRRIKSVSLTIPCVVGPYSGINATLRLLKSKTRTSPNTSGGYQEREGDDRFTYRFGAVDAIATSHGQRDPGLFDLTFRDDRYLPFEGAGAVSTWRLEVPKDCNALDFDTITDTVIHLNYTTRDAGTPLRDAARAASITPVQEGRRRLFSARQEFPDQWHRFLRPEAGADRHQMDLALTPDRFPFQLRGRKIDVTTARVYLKLADGTLYPGAGQPLTLTLTAPTEPGALRATLKSVPTVLPDLPFAVVDLSVTPRKPGIWRVEVLEADIAPLAATLRMGAAPDLRLNGRVVQDVLILLEYKA